MVAKVRRTLPPACLALLVFAGGPKDAAAQAGELDELRHIVAGVSVERVEADVRTLAGFGTRHTLSDTLSNTRGIGAARRWIKTQFDEISAACGGCLEVSYQTSLVGGTQRIPDTTAVVNVLAIQRGTTDPNRYVVMSGDIDSRASNALDGESDAPGANDNASGMAGVIEAARVLSQREFNGSIIYVGLSGEEQGLFGGQHMARVAKDEGWRIQAVLNNDMIGNVQGQNGVSDNTIARVFSEGIRADETPQVARSRRFTGGEVDSPSRNLARYIDRIADYVPNLDMMVVYRLDRFGRGGHHRPFNDVGFPGVRIMEANEDYRRQHQDIRVEEGVEYGDVIDEVEFDFAAKLTALNAISLAAMAWAPAPPRDVEVAGAVRPSTTLTWAPVPAENAPNLAGYKVYWRLTDAPQWQWSEFVMGDVNELTLENVVIDNYLFGVASVSDDGYESPVVFPWPIGAFEPLDWIGPDR
ncbi:MAG: M28 family metallopeptidase [Gemmatimonadota bacterium]|nr:M28 family metallopeptidase [Gemmatimonadota bacterium]